MLLVVVPMYDCHFHAFVMIKRLKHQLTKNLSISAYPILYHNDENFNEKNVIKLNLHNYCKYTKHEAIPIAAVKFY